MYVSCANFSFSCWGPLKSNQKQILTGCIFSHTVFHKNFLLCVIEKFLILLHGLTFDVWLGNLGRHRVFIMQRLSSAQGCERLCRCFHRCWCCIHILLREYGHLRTSCDTSCDTSCESFKYQSSVILLWYPGSGNSEIPLKQMIIQFWYDRNAEWLQFGALGSNGGAECSV